MCFDTQRIKHPSHLLLQYDSILSWTVFFNLKTIEDHSCAVQEYQESPCLSSRNQDICLNFALVACSQIYNQFGHRNKRKRRLSQSYQLPNERQISSRAAAVNCHTTEFSYSSSQASLKKTSLVTGKNKVLF